MRDLAYADIKYDVSENKFSHNLASDFGCFLIWNDARNHLDSIRTLLNTDFEVLLETEIEWSEEHFHDNAARLYEAPIFKTIQKKDRKSGHAKKIGGLKFFLFIVKDNNPNYNYAISVSNKIELSNLNIVNVKYALRDLVFADKAVKFAIHSTNNLHEFFFQVPLLLGVERFKTLLAGNKIVEKNLRKDLEGANGWTNYQEMFEILNLTSNYLVQRGFETLPSSNEDKDIDLLSDNYQRFASAIGMNQSKELPYKGFVSVNGEQISIDIRFVGDNYFNTAWAKDMLTSKKLYNGIFRPRNDHYFFSLIYHAKVQKYEIKPKYRILLQQLATDLRFDWFDLEILDDDVRSGKILKGYFQSMGYFYKTPYDSGVVENAAIIKNLPLLYVPTKLQKARTLLIRSIPKGALPIVKKIFKK